MVPTRIMLSVEAGGGGQGSKGGGGAGLESSFRPTHLPTSPGGARGLTPPPPLWDPGPQKGLPLHNCGHGCGAGGTHTGVGEGPTEDSLELRPSTVLCSDGGGGSRGQPPDPGHNPPCNRSRRAQVGAVSPSPCHQETSSPRKVARQEGPNPRGVGRAAWVPRGRRAGQGRAGSSAGTRRGPSLQTPGAGGGSEQETRGLHSAPRNAAAAPSPPALTASARLSRPPPPAAGLTVRVLLLAAVILRVRLAAVGRRLGPAAGQDPGACARLLHHRGHAPRPAAPRGHGSLG